MKTVLIGERLNLPGGRRAPLWDRYAYSHSTEDIEKWVRVSLRVRAFDSPTPVDRRNRERLLSLEGLPIWEQSLNLLPPAPAGEWRRPEDREAGDRIAGHLWSTRDWETWLLVGRRVAMCFGTVAAHLNYCEQYRDPATDRTLIVLPHPSGQNRLWNDPLADWRTRMREEGRNFREELWKDKET